ncbi:MAG: hypothetical protein BMS9Abin15_0118 [Gammaproteobacteria bacterium]|nr:MAG: hypothetical protein BMS9Abin15_0118 [Gammaproteobacteria bacterium]
MNMERSNNLGSDSITEPNVLLSKILTESLIDALLNQDTDYQVHRLFRALCHTGKKPSDIIQQVVREQGDYYASRLVDLVKKPKSN